MSSRKIREMLTKKPCIPEPHGILQEGGQVPRGLPQNTPTLPSGSRSLLSQELHALEGRQSSLGVQQPPAPAGPAGQAALLLIRAMLAQRLGIGSEQAPEPRNPNTHTFSPPALTKALLSGLGVSRRAHFPPRAGEPARVVSGMESMLPRAGRTCARSSPGCPIPLPEGTDRQHLLWAWQGCLAGGRIPDPPAPAPSPRPDQQAAWSLCPARAAGLGKNNRALVQTRCAEAPLLKAWVSGPA